MLPLIYLLYNMLMIQAKGSSLLSISKITNNGMKQVNEWLKNNRLSLHVSQINYMIMLGKGKNN